MATDAILRIAAKVTGEAEIKKMRDTISGVGPAASSAVPPVRRLGGALGDVAKVAAGIGLSQVISSLGGFVRGSLAAGDEAVRMTLRIKSLGDQFQKTAEISKLASDFAEDFTLAQNDASEITASLTSKLLPLGVSLEKVKDMQYALGQTSRIVGLSVRDQVEFFRQLAQALGQTKLQGDELRSMLERVPPLGGALVKAYNDIAKAKGIVQISKKEADEIIANIQRSETEQLKILQRSAEEKKGVIQKETDDKLQKIKETYDAELRLLQQKQEKELGLIRDRFDDEDRLRSRADRDARNQIFERLSDEERAVLKDFNRRREDAENYRDYMNDINGINEEVQKDIKRSDDDWWEEQETALIRSFEKRRQAIEDDLEDQKTIRDRGIRDQRKAEEDAIIKRFEGQEKAVNKRLAAEEAAAKAEGEVRLKAVEESLEKEMEMVKEQNKKLIAETKARVIATIGDIKRMGSEGLLGQDVVIKAVTDMPKLLGEIPPATALQKWDKTSRDFSTTVGKDLNPALNVLVDIMAKLSKGFQGLNQELRTTLIIAGGIVGGVAAIKGAGATLSWMRGGGKPVAPLAPPPIPPAAPTQRVFSGQYLKMMDVPKPPDPSSWAKFTEVVRGSSKEVLNFIGKLGGIITIVRGVGAAFAGTSIAATIAGWASVLGPSGPIAGALTSLIAWVGGTAVPALLAFFSGPAGWAVIAGVALAAAIYTWREPISGFLIWVGEEQEKFAEQYTRPFVQKIGDNMTEGLTKLRNEMDFESKVWDEFFLKLYEDFGKGIEAKIEEIKQKGMGKVLMNDLSFESKVWDEFFVNLYDDFGKNIEEKAGNLARGIAEAFTKGAEWIKTELNNILGLCEDAINTFYAWANNVLEKTSAITSKINMPITFRYPTIAIPRLARGGWFDRPALVEIGEGKDPGGEYAIPASRMPQAIDAWQRGARGQELVAAMQSPGLAPGRGGTGFSAPSGAPAQITLNIRPNQMLQTSDGRQWLSARDLPQIIAAAVAARR